MIRTDRLFRVFACRLPSCVSFVDSQSQGLAVSLLEEMAPRAAVWITIQNSSTSPEPTRSIKNDSYQAERLLDAILSIDICNSQSSCRVLLKFDQTRPRYN